jgi:hypothetical protein
MELPIKHPHISGWARQHLQFLEWHIWGQTPWLRQSWISFGRWWTLMLNKKSGMHAWHGQSASPIITNTIGQGGLNVYRRLTHLFGDLFLFITRERGKRIELCSDQEWYSTLMYLLSIQTLENKTRWRQTLLKPRACLYHSFTEFNVDFRDKSNMKRIATASLHTRGSMFTNSLCPPRSHIENVMVVLLTDMVFSMKFTPDGKYERGMQVFMMVWALRRTQSLDIILVKASLYIFHHETGFADLWIANHSNFDDHAKGWASKHWTSQRMRFHVMTLTYSSHCYSRPSGVSLNWGRLWTVFGLNLKMRRRQTWLIGSNATD